VAVSNDTESCGGPQADTDCKIDWSRKIHRCRSRLLYTAQE